MKYSFANFVPLTAQITSSTGIIHYLHYHNGEKKEDFCDKFIGSILRVQYEIKICKCLSYQRENSN